MSGAQKDPVCLRVASALGLRASADERLWAKVDSSQLRHPEVSKSLRQEQLQKLPDHPECLQTQPIVLPLREKDGIVWLNLMYMLPISNNLFGGNWQLNIVVLGRGTPYGFRFEPPESGGGGSHDYWHAQPITVVRTSTPFKLGIGDGCICTDVPAFPLHARCAVSLMDSLLLSLYGPNYLNDYIAEAALRQAVRSESPRDYLKLTGVPSESNAAHSGTKKGRSK